MQMEKKIGLLLVAALAVVAGCRYDRCSGNAVRTPEECPALTELPCVAAPGKAKLLDESGELALFSGETVEDADSNNAADPDRPYRNSLFLRRRRADGTEEWRVLLTSGSNWREATGMSESGSRELRRLENHLYIWSADFGSDRPHLKIGLLTGNGAWSVVCCPDDGLGAIWQEVIIDIEYWGKQMTLRGIDL